MQLMRERNDEGIQSVFLSVLLSLLCACASLATSEFDKSNTIGRDVDEVIQDIQKKGFSCRKYKSKEFPTNRLIGHVVCSIKESSPICPESYLISLFYELDTNKVNSFGKNQKTNCF